MDSKNRLVHCFMQCGIAEELIPYNETEQCTHPLDVTYKSAVLDVHPSEKSQQTAFDPVATKELCLPNGVRFVEANEASCPLPSFHSFVITREDGSIKYGGCLTYFATVTNPRILETFQTLLEMYKEQLRCEKEPKFRSNASHITDVILPSPSTVEPSITSLMMSKSIAMVVELPYVNFLKDYLHQLLDYSRKGGGEELAQYSLESYVHNVLYDVNCPQPGKLLKVTAPFTLLQIQMEPNSLPLFDYNLVELFNVVDPSTFLELFTSVLVENQVMLLSKEYQKLMLVAESLKCFLYPFVWNHVYVPIVPASYLHLIEAPVPFIMGLNNASGVEEQAEICMLDIDQKRLTVPEDTPCLPNKELLVSRLEEILHSYSSLYPQSTPVGQKPMSHVSSVDKVPSPLEELTSTRKRAHRPPKLRLVRQSQVEACDRLGGIDLGAPSTHETNLKIRNVFLDYLCRIFQSYEKFIIYPADREQWSSNRENMETFERDVFLCDQPTDNLTFLSKFLETNIFSSFIDLKILSSFNEINERVTWFDDRIEAIRKQTLNEIKSPTAEVRNTQLHKDNSLIEIICKPPKPNSDFVKGSDGHFPLLRASLLVETTDKNSENVSRKLLRQKTLREAKAKLEKANSQSKTPTLTSHKSVGSPTADSSIDRMIKAHSDFTNQLLKDCKNKVNRLLVLKMGPEAQGLGYDYVIRDVEENSLIGSLCDLIERVWNHGLLIREGKSALWSALRRYLDRWKNQHPHCSPSSTGSTSEDDSVDEISSRTHFFRRSQSTTSLLPASYSTGEQLYNDILSIKNLRLVRTDTSRTRAWIRLSIEKQCLQQYLELITEDTASISRQYKEYAFLRDDEKVTPFIKYLYTLSAVNFLCFTASFPKINLHYKLYIVNSNKFNAQTTANPWMILTGENRDTGICGLPRGEFIISIMARNLGELRSLRIGHDNTGLSPGWCLDHILVENTLNGHCTLFRCGCWLSLSDGDKSIERLLVGERIEREKYRSYRLHNDRSPTRAPPPTIDATVAGQEYLATAVNSLVKHCCRGNSSDGTLVSLLCGANGLVLALRRLLLCGLRPISRFNRGGVFVWDFIYKLFLELTEVDVCHPDQPAVYSFVKCINMIQSSSSNVGLDGKFQTLVCLGIQEKMLHRWFYIMSQSLAGSKHYDHNSVFKNESMVLEIMGLLKILSELDITIDKSLIQHIER